MVLAVPGQLDRERGSRLARFDRLRLQRLAMGEESQRCLRGGTDQGGNFEDGCAVQLFRELDVHGKFQEPVSCLIGRRRDAEVQDLELRLRARDTRPLCFGKPVEGRQHDETEDAAQYQGDGGEASYASGCVAFQHGCCGVVGSVGGERGGL